jgi:hypothetical protein
MASTQKHFCVTLFSTASRYIYDTEHAGRFHCEISTTRGPGHDIRLGVGVCEISCYTSQLVDTHTLIYCNLIALQFVGDSTVRCMRAFVIDTSSHREFHNVHYVPVE